MQGTLSLNTILEMLAPLSASNKKWLADRLYEQVEQPQTAEIDPDIKAMEIGFRCPKGLSDDYKKEIGEARAARYL